MSVTRQCVVTGIDGGKYPNPHSHGQQFAKWLVTEIINRLNDATFSKATRNLAQSGNGGDFVNFGLRATTTKLRLTRSCNVEATLINIRGVEAAANCVQCSSGSGPFDKCITSSIAGRLSCGNCHYNSSGARCSFRQAYAYTHKSTPAVSDGEEEQNEEEQREEEEAEDTDFEPPRNAAGKRKRKANRLPPRSQAPKRAKKTVVLSDSDSQSSDGMAMGQMLLAAGFVRKDRRKLQGLFKLMSREVLIAFNNAEDSD